jgi:hypothetical protein
MIKPDPHNWEDMAIKLQRELEMARAGNDDYEALVDSMEVDIAQLKTIIEYLEVKLGINDPV